MKRIPGALLFLFYPGIIAFSLEPAETIDPEKRHPGHKMEVSFTPKNETSRIGETIEVSLKIKNIGDTPFMFWRGGMQRGERDNQFAFSAQQRQKMLPDVGNPIHFGGKVVPVILKPNESTTIPVDLTNWFHFSEPGTIYLHSSYLMRFGNPEAPFTPPFWVDYACAEFSIRVRK